MSIMNYTMQDIFGVFSGVFLFVLILVIPGYATVHIFDLFDFKKRQRFVRFGIGLLVSSAISPILLFLAYRLVSNTFTLIVLFGFAVTFALILVREHSIEMFFKSILENKFARAILGIAVVWIFFATLLLVDIQWGNRLYFNIVAYDYSTRAAVVNAITRSGVPPINPSFYPGEPVKLTFLYYFWYILCSLVDQLGGKVVDSRAALIASVIWAGLILMATIALYLRIRNTACPANKTWHAALTGIGLLTVSGLDLFGSTFYMLFPKYLFGHVVEGDIEHWNEQITAWVGATVWTPHHLVSLLNCVLGWLLIVYHQGKSPSQRLSSACIAGLAFASAFGLSSWITAIFVIFWIIWMITRLLGGDPFKNILILFLPGIVAAVAIFPFVIDLYSGARGGGGIVGTSALAFDVREFWPATIFINDLPAWQQMIARLLLLPLNYFLELGFFLLVGIYWYRCCGKDQLNTNPLARGEMILLFASSFLATFFRSTLISNNDFGWRGWLPGQFILLMWGTDIISYVWSKQPDTFIYLFQKPISIKTGRIFLASLLAIGILTSLQNVLLLRTWPVLTDTGLINSPGRFNYPGKSVFEARALYQLIEDQTSTDAIIQSNPGLIMDRPAGLYRTRNSFIAPHTLYGVPEETFRPLLEEAENIFKTETSTWQSLDAACRHYSIDLLILKDSDALWNNLDRLKSERQPLFIGEYYSAFYCGGN